VKGNLLIGENRLSFHPLFCQENTYTDIHRFKTIVDYFDILDCVDLQLHNASSRYV